MTCCVYNLFILQLKFLIQDYTSRLINHKLLKKKQFIPYCGIICLKSSENIYILKLTNRTIYIGLYKMNNRVYFLTKREKMTLVS